MNPLCNWHKRHLKEAANRLESGEDVLPLSLPHPRFKYPAFPRLGPADQEDPDTLIASLLSPQNPKAVHLGRDLLESCKQWLRSMGLKKGDKVAVLAPASTEFTAAFEDLELETHYFSRDPEDLPESAEFWKVQAVLLSNPSRVDGFFYPEELYAKLFLRIRSFCSAPVLSEESLRLFSFNQIPPGSLRKLSNKKNLYFCSSVFPAMSPQGPQLSWWMHDSDQKDIAAAPTLAPSREMKIQAAEALLAFQSRQGPAIAEFQRRMLLVQKGLRIFSDEIRELSASQILSVPHWPETGFHIVLKIAALKGSNAKENIDFCDELFAKSGLLLTPGAFFGMPDRVQLCFAAPPSVLKEAALRLKNFLSL